MPCCKWLQNVSFKEPCSSTRVLSKWITCRLSRAVLDALRELPLEDPAPQSLLALIPWRPLEAHLLKALLRGFSYETTRRFFCLATRARRGGRKFQGAFRAGLWFFPTMMPTANPTNILTDIQLYGYPLKTVNSWHTDLNLPTLHPTHHPTILILPMCQLVQTFQARRFFCSARAQKKP